jgi:AP-1 complex subunit mu
MAVTNAVSWRSEGIRYRKNEVFLDVIESVNLLVNANGNVVRSEILGAVKMKCYLSGMPELRLGLNDKVMFESTGRSESSKVFVLFCCRSRAVLSQLREARRSKWRT